MFHPNLIQQQLESISQNTTFSAAHFAIRHDIALAEMLRAAQPSATIPLRIELTGVLRQRASCVLAELAKQASCNPKHINII